MYNMRISCLLALTTALAVSVAAPALAAKITIFDVSGATDTYADAINDPGAITGDSSMARATRMAFVRVADGTITSFDVSGGTQTQPDSINDKGAITGYFQVISVYQSFVRSADGTITTFYDTGATTVAAINDKGAITGSWQDTSQIWHGFVRTKNGTITSFDPTGSIATYPFGINRRA